MKSIRDFLEGKLRRAEVEDRLNLEFGLPDHAELGPHEATLISAVGRLVLYRSGLLLSDGTALPYQALSAVTLSPPSEECFLDLHTDARIHRLRASPAGALVVHATLRWIGNVILRRPLA